MPCMQIENGFVCYRNQYEINVDGKIWRFEFHRYLGVGWLRKDGELRVCQYPTNKRVWEEFEKWYEASEYSTEVL